LRAVAEERAFVPFVKIEGSEISMGSKTSSKKAEAFQYNLTSSVGKNMPQRRNKYSQINHAWQEGSLLKLSKEMAPKAKPLDETLQPQPIPTNGRQSEAMPQASLPSNGHEKNSISVLIADDHPLAREGMSSLINRRSNMHVVAEANNGAEAVELFFATKPDVALIDLRMPVMDGIQTVLSIRERKPDAKIGIVSAFQCEEDIYRVLRAGARGYLVKGASIDEIFQCIETIGKGNTWIPPWVGAKLAKRVCDRELTAREMEVLHAVTSGKSNKEIGVVFDISEATVKVHVTHVLEKLHVAGRTEAINVAVKRGLVRMDESVAA
jgi:DNA-binding NarL/FixJ family response regulator